MKSSRRHLVWGLLAGSLLASLAGCGSYPTVSPAAYKLAQGVVRICNGRRADQLATAGQLVAAEHQAGSITDRERRYLNDILQLAADGSWERAERNARRLVADQSGW